jgi:hypothetical protein
VEVLLEAAPGAELGHLPRRLLRSQVRFFARPSVSLMSLMNVPVTPVA